MMKNKTIAAGFGLLIAATGALGLTGCSSDSDDAADTPTAAVEQTDVDVAGDLQTARQAVLDALADDPSWTQVMLASDVDKPTQKYGLLVMPYVASDAADHVTGTVNIDGDKFVIEAESAATGKTWQIDQDGTITEVTE